MTDGGFGQSSPASEHFISKTNTVPPPEISEFEQLLRKPNSGEFQLALARKLQRRQHGCLALEMIGALHFSFGAADEFAVSAGAFRHLA